MAAEVAEVLVQVDAGLDDLRVVRGIEGSIEERILRARRLGGLAARAQAREEQIADLQSRHRAEPAFNQPKLR